MAGQRRSWPRPAAGRGWWVLAGLAALAGLAVIGQALTRQAVATGANNAALAALGMRPRELTVLGLLRTLVIATAAAAGRWPLPRRYLR